MPKPIHFPVVWLLALCLGLLALAPLPPARAQDGAPPAAADEPPHHSTYLPALFKDYCPDFAEDFQSAPRGWPVSLGNSGSAAIVNGEYQMLTRQAGVRVLAADPTCPRVNYTVETDAHWMQPSGAAYGIFFGMQDDGDRVYFFQVSADYQTFWVIRRENGSETVLVGKRITALIAPRKETNHLKVQVQGESFSVFVNQQPLATVTEDGFGGLSRAGLFSGSYSGDPSSEARFDNYHATWDSSPLSTPPLNQNLWETPPATPIFIGNWFVPGEE
jgi:hypothetical protein